MCEVKEKVHLFEFNFDIDFVSLFIYCNVAWHGMNLILVYYDRVNETKMRMKKAEIVT